MIRADYRLSFLPSYERALDRWKSIKPIRGRADQNTRPLHRRRDNNLSIRLDPTTQDVVIRLYRTDVLTYRPDNTIVLEPYCSVTTTQLVSTLLPGVHAMWSDRAGLPSDLIKCPASGRIYSAASPVIQYTSPSIPLRVLPESTRPIEVCRLVRSEAKEAIDATNFKAYRAWLRTMFSLDVRPNKDSLPTDSSRWAGYREMVDMLAKGLDDTRYWVALGWRVLYDQVAIDTHLTYLRQAIYARGEVSCIDKTTVPYFEGYSQMRSAQKSNNMYKYA